MRLLDALFEHKFVATQSDARRIVAQGGIFINGEKQDPQYWHDRTVKPGDILRCGKKSVTIPEP